MSETTAQQLKVRGSQIISVTFGKWSTVCLEACKSLKRRNSPNISTSAHSAGMKWHHHPNCYISFVVGIITIPLSPHTGWCLQEPERPSKEVSLHNGGSDCVWSSHLCVSNRHRPAGRSVLNKPAVESVFVLEGNANKRSRGLTALDQTPLQLSTISLSAH